MSYYNKLYCVDIDKHSGQVSLQCIGIDCVDNQLNDSYDSLDDLPTWLQNKVYALHCMDADSSLIKGLGYRFNGRYYIEE